MVSDGTRTRESAPHEVKRAGRCTARLNTEPRGSAGPARGHSRTLIEPTPLRAAPRDIPSRNWEVSRSSERQRVGHGGEAGRAPRVTTRVATALRRQVVARLASAQVPARSTLQ